MAFNLNKSKIRISANKPTSAKSSSGGLVAAFKKFEDTPPETEEAQVAFTDSDTSARYIRLQSKGLNILRTEIVAITEFIPIAVGNDDTEEDKIRFVLMISNCYLVRSHT